jgi:hypothetical protein
MSALTIVNDFDVFKDRGPELRGSGLALRHQPASSLLEPRKQFLTDQFQALFVAVVLKAQIEHQVFDISCAELFDLRSAVIGVPDDQQAFEIFDRLKLSGRRLYPVAASFRALRKGPNVDTCPSFLSVLIDARDRDIAQSNLPVGQLPQILYPVIESRHCKEYGVRRDVCDLVQNVMCHA